MSKSSENSAALVFESRGAIASLLNALSNLSEVELEGLSDFDLIALRSSLKAVDVMLEDFCIHRGILEDTKTSIEILKEHAPWIVGSQQLVLRLLICIFSPMQFSVHTREDQKNNTLATVTGTH